MEYQLITGNKNYSSWSMRIWLLVEWLGLSYEEASIKLYTATNRDEVKALGGETGLVPTLMVKQAEQSSLANNLGFAVWDTMAIIEYLYEEYPAVWPTDKWQRARARSICAEMATGMFALREALPVNIRARYPKAELPAAAKAEVQRICDIWQSCLANSGGPWLFGEFSAADIIYAPVATRFVTYNVDLTDEANAYKERILNHPLVKKWCELGAAETATLPMFDK